MIPGQGGRPPGDPPSPIHVLVGEYPPQPGGVADYTRQVALGMAEAGLDVHVWAPGTEGDDREGGVCVHRAAGSWSRRDLEALGARLDAFAGPRSILVQYTPNSWGYKGVNLGFCRWLKARARGGDRVRSMVHEAAYPWMLRDKPTRLLALPTIHRLMLRSLLSACERIWYSTESMVPLFLRHGPADLPRTCLPVPSNVPTVDDPEGVAALRREVAPDGSRIVGNFGLNAGLRPLLDAQGERLLGSSGRVLLLIGRGGDRYAEELVRRRPELDGRVKGTGGLDPESVSRHLQACDLVIQPYEDGVTTRRGTVMAALAQGCPVVTNRGERTEAKWWDGPGVALGGHDWAEMAALADRLLDDPGSREALGRAARSLYAERFALGRTVAAMREPW